QPVGDRWPGVAVIVAARDADPGPVGPAAVILDVEPAGRVLVARDLVHALPEFRVGIWHEPGTDALVGSRERGAAVFAQVVPAGRDAEVHTVPVAQDRVHALPAVSRLPCPSVLVVDGARNHLRGSASCVDYEHR